MRTSVTTYRNFCNVSDKNVAGWRNAGIAPGKVGAVLFVCLVLTMFTLKMKISIGFRSFYLF